MIRPCSIGNYNLTKFTSVNYKTSERSQALGRQLRKMATGYIGVEFDTDNMYN
jgi:hypothetical protein